MGTFEGYVDMDCNMKVEIACCMGDSLPSLKGCVAFGEMNSENQPFERIEKSFTRKTLNLVISDGASIVRK